MSMPKKKMSLADTPIRRALDRARRSTLLLLFAVGLLIGLGYKLFVAKKTAPEASSRPAVSAPQKP